MTRWVLDPNHIRQARRRAEATRRFRLGMGRPPRLGLALALSVLGWGVGCQRSGAEPSERAGTVVTAVAEARPAYETADVGSADAPSSAVKRTRCLAYESRDFVEFARRMNANDLAEDAQYLYLAAFDADVGLTTLNRIAKDASTSERLYQKHSQQMITGLAPTPKGIYFIHDSTLFWLPHGQAVPTALGSDVNGPLVQTAQYLYSTHFDAEQRVDEIVRINKRTRRRDVLLSSPRPNLGLSPAGFTDMASDGQFLYVANPSTEQLLRVPLAGGAAQQILKDERVYLLDLTQDRVYFLTAPEGRIASVTRSGVARVDYGVHFKLEPFVVRSGFLYGMKSDARSNPHRLLKMPLNRGGQSTVLAAEHTGTYLTLLGGDEDCFYAVETAVDATTVLAHSL